MPPEKSSTKSLEFRLSIPSKISTVKQVYQTRKIAVDCKMKLDTYRKRSIVIYPHDTMELRDNIYQGRAITMDCHHA